MDAKNAYIDQPALEVNAPEPSAKARGGIARAEKLSSEKKSAIAKLGAEARWKSGSVDIGPKRVYITDHSGMVPVGAMELECAVLDGEIRVLSERALVRAFGAKRGGAHWRRKAAGAEGSDLPVVLSAGNLQPFIDDDLRSALNERYLYRVKGRNGSAAFGMRAELLPQICEVFLKVRQAERTTGRSILIGGQAQIADAAEMLIRSLAKVGIVALVDEVTGYQRVRDRNALQDFLRQMIGEELAKWEKKFPQEFYRETFRLKNWTFDENSSRRPIHMAQITAEYIYNRLGPEVLKELQNRSPKDESGRRKNKLFQALTVDVGHPALDRQLERFIIVATASTSWDQFVQGMDRVSPKPNKQAALNL